VLLLREELLCGAEGKMMEKFFLELINVIEKSIEKDPWMKEQTLKSLKDEPVNEANELKAAIETNDVENLKEELGDLIHDSVLMTLLAEKEGLLNRKEVLQMIIDKIKRRKPHVFGNAKAETKEEAAKLWHEAKQKEKKK